MHHCPECSRLADLYRNQALTFRNALTAVPGRVSFDALDKLQDCALAARRTLLEHERTHDPHRYQEMMTAAPGFQGGVNIWPSILGDHLKTGQL